MAEVTSLPSRRIANPLCLPVVANSSGHVFRGSGKSEKRE